MPTVRNRLELKPILDAVCAKWPSSWIQIRLKRANVRMHVSTTGEHPRPLQVRDNEFIQLVDVPLQGRLPR